MSYDVIETEISLVEIIKLILERWLSNLAIIIFLGGVFFSFSLLIKNKYLAEIVVMPVSEQSGSGSNSLNFMSQLGTIASAAGVGVSNGGSAVDANLAVLRSREFTNKFISDNQLLRILVPNEKAGFLGRVFNLTEKTDPTMWDAFDVFDSEVRSLTIDKKTGLVTLGIVWTDPELSAKWANDLVEGANAHLRSKAIEESEKMSAYLQREVDKTANADMRAVLYKLIEKQKQNAVLAQVKNEYAFQIIDHAVVPEKKVFPRRSSFLVFGLLGGVGLVLVRVFWIYTKNKVK